MKKHILVLGFLLFLASLFRLYSVTTNPPGLYVDEIANGYNAYTILTTGKDEYGTAYPLWFRSYDDYKPPIYIYSVSLAMGIVGKNELAVRLPSILAGILSVAVIYFLVRELLRKDKIKQFSNESLALLTSGLLAFSPWHIQFSRGGFEVTLGLSFYLTAVWQAAVFFRTKKMSTLIISFVLFVLSIYTYHTFKIISPLTVLILISYFLFSFPKKRGEIGGCFLLFCVLLVPLILFSLTPEGSARFSQTAAFSEYPVKNAFQAVLTYPIVYLKNYLTHFSPYFLFSFGDGFGRHQIPGFGLLPKWQIFFLVLGLFGIWKLRKTLFARLVLLLLFLSPIASSLARPSPHSLRSLPLVIPITILIAVGVVYALPYLKKIRYLPLLAVSLIALYETLFFTHYYLSHYPNVNIIDWGAGYKQTVTEVTKIQNNYDAIVLDDGFKFAPLYFKFYAPDTKIKLISNTWIKPASLQDKKILLVRPFYGDTKPNNLVKNVYLPNPNHDVYSQLIKL